MNKTTTYVYTTIMSCMYVYDMTYVCVYDKIHTYTYLCTYIFKPQSTCMRLSVMVGLAFAYFLCKTTAATTTTITYKNNNNCKKTHIPKAVLSFSLFEVVMTQQHQCTIQITQFVLLTLLCIQYNIVHSECACECVCECTYHHKCHLQQQKHLIQLIEMFTLPLLWRIKHICLCVFLFIHVVVIVVVVVIILAGNEMLPIVRCNEYGGRYKRSTDQLNVAIIRSYIRTYVCIKYG